MNKTFSVVIIQDGANSVAVNGLLRSIAKQTLKPKEVFIISQENPLNSAAFNWIIFRKLDIEVQWFCADANALRHTINQATGEFVLLSLSNLKFFPDALETMSQFVETHGPDAFYGFESQQNPKLRRKKIMEKPDWSPIKFLQKSYLGNFVVFNRKVCLDVGSFRSGEYKTAVFDTVLRFEENSKKILCLKTSTALNRQVGGEGLSSQELHTIWLGRLKSVSDYLHRTRASQSASLGERFPLLKLSHQTNSETRTSVVIPTRGSSADIRGKRQILIETAIRSLRDKTNHHNYEIIVVADQDTPEEAILRITEIGEIELKIIIYSKPFNFSEKCNLGALHSNGMNLIFLNDDVEILSSNFIERLTGPLVNSEVGQVGVVMYFEDGTLQHAGHVYSHGEFMHAYSGLQVSEIKSFSDMLTIDREVSGLTAACISVTRELFFSVGGFNESLPGNFNDVDFSLKIRQMGKSNLLIHDLEINHFESKSRITTVLPEEISVLRERWGFMNYDPYFVDEKQHIAGF